MLSALWSVRGYLLLGFFSFLVFLLVTVPLHFVWPYAKSSLGTLPFQVQQVSGTLWKAEVQLEQRQVGAATLKWDLSPWSLLVLKPNAEFSLVHEQAEFSGALSVSAAQQIEILNGQGYVDSELAKPALRRERIELEGALEISDLAATFDLTPQHFSDLSGRIVFTGGGAKFPIQRKTVTAEVPTLVGNLGMDSDRAVLDLMTTEKQSLGQGFLQSDGWGGVAIKRRLIDVLGQKWPQQADEDTVVFEVSRKIL